MTFLLLTVLFGIVFAYFATQNVTPTVFHFAGYTWRIPLYIIALGSLLIGFFISWIVSGIDAIFSLVALHVRDRKVKSQQKDVETLQEKVHELEVENAKLQSEEDIQSHEGITHSGPSFGKTFRHHFSL